MFYIMIFVGPVAQWITYTDQYGSSPGRFVFLRMRQNGVKKNKSQVNRAFLLN